MKYKIVRGRWRKKWGHTENPKHEAPEMGFHEQLADDPKLMEILIHEGLHALFWDMSEIAVRDSARDIARFLNRCGFKLGGRVAK